MATVNMVCLETHKITQYNFGFEREDGTTIKVKFFQAPYATWWLDHENRPINLLKEEQDAMHSYLRTTQRIKRNLDNRRQPQEVAVA